MSLTINTRTYSADTPANNAWIYRDANATAARPSTLRMARTPPKPTPTFQGQSKTEVKLAKTVEVNLMSLPALIRAESSVPVGMAGAELDTLIADFRSIVASPAFVSLVKDGTIYHA